MNPASRIRRKAENNQSVRFLTPEEEEADSQGALDSLPFLPSRLHLSLSTPV